MNHFHPNSSLVHFFQPIKTRVSKMNYIFLLSRHMMTSLFKYSLSVGRKKRVLPLIFPAERSSFLGPLNLIRALVTFKGTFTVKGSMDSRERFPSCICSLKLTNSILLFLGKSKKYRENK